VTRFESALAVSLLLFLAAGCGSNDQRQLQSITLTSTPSGDQVQFVATGHYSKAPTKVSPLPVLWAVYLTGGQAGPSITQNGLAQCAAGVPGTFWVLVWAPSDPNIPISQLNNAKKVVVAQATMNCP
jgi:hypothetical protein